MAPHRSSRAGKVRKELWLDSEILHRAQKILGTATERETVEVALDLIAFQRELADAARALAGLEIEPLRSAPMDVEVQRRRRALLQPGPKGRVRSKQVDLRPDRAR